MRTLSLDQNPCDQKIAHVRVSLIVDTTLSADAIEAELRSHLDAVPSIYGAVVTLTHTEPI